MAGQPASEERAIANTTTNVKSRVDSTLGVRPRDFDNLLATTVSRGNLVRLPAQIGGLRIDLETDIVHLAAFWRKNWSPATNDVQPDAVLRALAIPGVPPHAYYCPQRDDALLVNTDYYGQCKSWALGMVAAILQRRFGIHSIHGAAVELHGRGVVIVGGTGSGKSTQVATLCKSHGARLIGDDWTFVDSQGNGFRIFQPERMLYIRTDNAANDPVLADQMRGALLENVVTKKGECSSPTCRGGACMLERGEPYCLWGHPNARALVPREWLAGTAGLADEAPLGLVVVLYRDAQDSRRTTAAKEEVLDFLKRGPSEVRPGAGPAEKWGTMSSVPYYNPYLLAPDSKIQDHAFAAETACGALLINTAHLDIGETAFTIAEALARGPGGF